MILTQKKEDQLNEFIRCSENYDYFIRNYILLELPGGDEYFKPYDKQVELLDAIEREKYIFVIKSRQIGISTILKAYCVWLTIFHDNVVVGIVSKDASEATVFARDIRKMIDKIPKWLQPGYDKYTEQSFILKNGSKVYASPVAPASPEKCLRGKAITFLVIDEAAFIKFIDEAWTSMVPALSTNQMQARKAGVPYGTVILSTPNKTQGVGKWYYEKYKSAVSNKDIFKEFKIHWRNIPELANDPLWYENQCKLLAYDQKKIKQELEMQFVASSGSFFPDETISKLQENKKDPKERFKLFGGEVWVFADPVPGKNYLIGVDTASEFGNDYSTIEVFDYVTLEQVWEYQVKTSVTNFSKVVKFACSQYQGLVIPENNSYGNQVSETLSLSEYSGMLYQYKKSSNIVVPGLNTNTLTRPLMIDALYSYIVQFPHNIYSERLINELIGLVEHNGKVQADIGENDDLTLATAFTFYVRKYDPPLMLSDEFSRDDSFFKDIIDLNDDNKIVRFTDNDTQEFKDNKMQSLNIDLKNKAKFLIDNKMGTKTQDGLFVDMFKVLSDL